MITKYTEDHAWLTMEGNIATVGITVHAQGTLGDVVFVDLPAVGTTFAQKATAVVVESVKAAADVYMPAMVRRQLGSVDAEEALVSSAGRFLPM